MTKTDFKGWKVCYYCGKEMTKEDYNNFEPQMCCNGHGCGCMGLPTEPPYCIECYKSDKDNKGE